MKHLPQEIEVWYVIPAIRRELAKAFISEYNLSQKIVSEKLGITESAVSQYIKEKRGGELQFSDHEKQIIKKSAKRIMENKVNVNEELYKLTKKLKGTDSVCEFHKKHDLSVPHDCNICN